MLIEEGEGGSMNWMRFGESLPLLTSPSIAPLHTLLFQTNLTLDNHNSHPPPPVKHRNSFRIVWWAQVAARRMRWCLRLRETTTYLMNVDRTDYRLKWWSSFSVLCFLISLFLLPLLNPIYIVYISFLFCLFVLLNITCLHSFGLSQNNTHTFTLCKLWITVTY